MVRKAVKRCAVETSSALCVRACVCVRERKRQRCAHSPHSHLSGREQTSLPCRRMNIETSVLTGNKNKN